MRLFRILVIALLLRSNVVGKYGDKVTEDQLTDSVDKLIAEKYIEEVESESEEKSEPQGVQEPIVSEVVTDPIISLTENPQPEVAPVVETPDTEPAPDVVVQDITAAAPVVGKAKNPADIKNKI